MSLPKNAVVARGLCKVYSRRQAETVALRNFDLDIPRGSFFGLLGPNGAGPTTSFYAVVGLVRPDSGQVLTNMFATR